MGVDQNKLYAYVIFVSLPNHFCTVVTSVIVYNFAPIHPYKICINIDPCYIPGTVHVYKCFDCTGVLLCELYAAVPEVHRGGASALPHQALTHTSHLCTLRSGYNSTTVEMYK